MLHACYSRYCWRHIVKQGLCSWKKGGPSIFCLGKPLLSTETRVIAWEILGAFDSENSDKTLYFVKGTICFWLEGVIGCIAKGTSVSYQNYFPSLSSFINIPLLSRT